MPRATSISFSILVLFFFSVFDACALDLSRATIVTPANLTRPEQKAILMLVDEISKRCGVRMPVSQYIPAGISPVLLVGPQSQLVKVEGSQNFLAGISANGPAEGFSIRVRTGDTRRGVAVAGNDSRGVLFGVGHLLRKLHFASGKVSIDDDYSITTAPKYPLRGHQLGYRPKTNSYDAWDVDVWEQYFRDLIIFGCNAIELIPPRSDDAPTSPHFPKPQMEMMIAMSKLADDYGLDVWIWYPAMDPDYSKPATVEFALKEWGDVFKKLPRINAVFVPGGDPGHTQPKYMMALLEKQAANLRRFHPHAQMWMSPQSFTTPWMDEFLEIMKRDEPKWFSGIVYGPQVRTRHDELRAAVSTNYPMRLYPDITHSRQCQYPVPDWDRAFALTEARECINPRPTQEAAIFRATAASSIGFITYSEGCNDDVNKMVWSALGWNPDVSIEETLRDFSRYFIGEEYADGFAQGLLALEKNWKGPVLSNSGIDVTLTQFQAMERTASPSLMKNWRFQQGLFRAYYDAYIRRRLIYETDLENRALDKLRLAPKFGANHATSDAAQILDQVKHERVADDLRQRVFELGDDLYHSIRMQLSVKKYKAIAVDRGAALDTIDYPLNNRAWLKQQFFAIRRKDSESERSKAIDAIVNWENPGPGGFYDDLGNPARQPHLSLDTTFETDPGAMIGTRSGFEEGLVVDEPDEKPDRAWRTAWMDHAESLYDSPLKMKYTGLDPTASYRLRIVYGGDSQRRKIRLATDSGIEIHPLITKPFPIKPMEFDVPQAATKSGTLQLHWYREPGLGGNGRGCQVSEIWLMRK